MPCQEHDGYQVVAFTWDRTFCAGSECQGRDGWEAVSCYALQVEGNQLLVRMVRFAEEAQACLASNEGWQMIPDWKTNLVYFSGLLPRRYPAWLVG